jgi:hypothetical protein
LSLHMGTWPDFSRRSLARSSSSSQIASASAYFLALKTMVGRPSTSIVNVEIDSRSVISFFLIAFPGNGLAAGRLDCFDAVAQVSKIVEGLNLHRFRRLWNSDDKDLVFVLFHSFVDVCEVDEVIFRDQGIVTFVFVVDGN